MFTSLLNEQFEQCFAKCAFEIRQLEETDKSNTFLFIFSSGKKL